MFTASTMEGEKKWKKRMLALAKAERMRAAKKLRDETSAAISPIADLTPTSTSPVTVSLSPEPGPSGLQQEVSVAVATSNEGGILTDDGESSSSESDFDDETAQGLFDDWVVSLRSYDRKMLSVSLLHAYKTRQGMGVVDAAQESASFTGFNEKTVRRYRKQFIEGKGKFEEGKQGKYERHCLLHEEELLQITS